VLPDIHVGLEALDLPAHPAFKAWCRLCPNASTPIRIEKVFDVRSRGHKGKHGATVFRLHGLQPEGTCIIAKRSKKGPAEAERDAYQFLSCLSVPGLRYFGFVEDTDACWLFLEDGGDQQFVSGAPDHRAAAYRCIARMHTESAKKGSADRFRDRGISYYDQLCHRSRDDLAHNAASLALDLRDKQVLETLVFNLDEIGKQWDTISRICKRFPYSLTHGALLKRNLRVRSRAGQVDFLAFDWEHSGWGVPAIDVAWLLSWSPCSGARDYWTRVRRAWPGVSPDDIEQLAKVGRLFRLIRCIAWESPYLAAHWYEKPLRNLQGYAQELSQHLIGSRVDIP